MRVGLAIETDIPGGAERMMLELARELLRRGHEVVALGGSSSMRGGAKVAGEGWLTARFAELGIEREAVAGRGLFWLRPVSEIVSVIRTRRLSVLHSHEFAMAVCGAAAARWAGCRHVITMHGGTYYARKLRRRMALRLASALSDHTVVVSEASRESFAASLGVRPEKVEVVHNGVSPIETAEASVRAELGVAAEDVLVLAVGSLLPVKGHAVLLEALSRMPSRGRIVVAIAGVGPEEASLRTRARDLGVDAEVQFLGFRDDIPALLRSADIFAMPSLSEGLPMAMIEAMLAGKAIVASDAGGIRELLPGPDVGLLVAPGDAGALAAALGTLVREPALRGRLGAAARARALAQFTASAMADQYLARYGASGP